MSYPGQQLALPFKVAYACLRLILFVVVLAMLSACELREKQSGIDSEVDKLFKNAFTANKNGKFLSIPHKAEFLANAENNFLFFSWINLKSLPDDGERLVLFSKYSGKPPNIAGYALGVRKDGSIYRPVVFWGDGSKNGKWLDFPEIQLVAGEWNFFAIHVHAANFIGLYSFKHVQGLKTNLIYHGSHQIDFEAKGEAEILFGSPPGRAFRGKIGPFGIINPFRFRIEEVESVLNQYLQKPEDFSAFGDKENIKLLRADLKQDN